MIKNSFVKVNIEYENLCQKTLELDEMKTEEHKYLDDNSYKDNVSYYLIPFFFYLCLYLYFYDKIISVNI